jgi:O-antigen/teichoic acid export membrane protein
MSARGQLMRNSVLSLALNVANRASNVILFVFIARQAGAEQGGIFSLSTSYLVLFSSLTWGLDELMVRQVARDRSTSSRYFGAFLALRFLLATGLYGALVLVVRSMLRYAPITTGTILIVGLSLVPDSLGNVGQALLTAHERFETPVKAATLATFVKLAGGAAALLGGGGLAGVGWAWCAGSGLGALITLSAASRLAGTLRPAEWLERDFWTQQARPALPFLVIGFLITMEYQTDVVILSVARGEVEIGWYSAATTVVLALMLLSQAYRAAVYPLMTRYHQSAPSRLNRLYDVSFIYLGAAALPMAAGICLLAPRIVRLYGPSFDGAIAPLQIIAWSLVFNYLNVPSSRLMLVDDRQNWSSVFLIGSMSTNIILNLILDRQWGATGAAAARLCSSLVFFLPNYLFVIRFIRPHNPFRALARPALAAIIMAAVVWLTRGAALWIPITVGTMVYVAALLVVKGLPGEEQQWLATEILRRLRFIRGQ